MEKTNKKFLVTGGCGYIGGHTLVALLKAGYEVVSIDNLSRGSMKMLEGVEEISGKKIKNYQLDLCNATDVKKVFDEHQDISGVIHFAAYKSVPESVADPLLYFQNNNGSLVTLLGAMKDAGVKNFIFSSSCSVYGNVDTLPVVEETPMAAAESPYARTKQMGEQMCQDLAAYTDDFNIILLRYFNPVGAHPSTIIGELQKGAENLVPVITQTAIGKRESMTIFGTDYHTRDGSCVRDYIHVMDIAEAHRLALEYLVNNWNKEKCEVYNLGSGNGVTVLELIAAFEKCAGLKLNYLRGPRREGDVVAVYADNAKARKNLGWDCKYDLDAMMETAWAWEQKLSAI